MFKVVLVSLLMLSASWAEARVFDINKESFAGYFSGSASSSTLGTAPVNGETGNVAYSGGIKYMYGGEFGFVYSTKHVSFRFGMELLKPTALETKATSSGTDWYSAESNILGYAPKIGVEINLHGNQISRSYLSLAAGAASVTMKNDYTFTAAGTSALGLTDHSAESKGSGTIYEAGLGYENILTDTTTIAVEFGYRYFKVDQLSYTKDVNTFGGAKTSGNTIVNADGSSRSLDMSGAFISLGFRFYL